MPSDRPSNLKEWVCEYTAGEKKYSLKFETFDHEDPEERIRGIRESLVLLGELGGEIPAADLPVQQSALKVYNEEDPTCNPNWLERRRFNEDMDRLDSSPCRS